MTPPSPDPGWPIGFGATCLRAVLYILFIAALAQGVYWEALYLPEARFSERGFTELAQTGVLAVATLLLAHLRWRWRTLPEVTLLLFAFVASSLIREQDAHLDAHVFDGAWQLLVALIVLPTLFWMVRQRRRFLEQFAHLSNTFSFGFFAAGVLTTYVFSRLYGRADFWMAVLEEHYVRDFKSAAEEVVELLGYALILIAMIELLLLARRWRQASQTR
ncbi:hypothetical protein [Halomonas sp. NO4]|uniref:hypothetical protein n=1 Tax=Halomonas sp. NO4 TaxID=2484813 RepID=UPI001F095200|nr:hypothetical protein [Halomonas sp. NO4]